MDKKKHVQASFMGKKNQDAPNPTSPKSKQPIKEASKYYDTKASFHYELTFDF